MSEDYEKLILFSDTSQENISSEIKEHLENYLSHNCKSMRLCQFDFGSIDINVNDISNVKNIIEEIESSVACIACGDSATRKIADYLALNNESILSNIPILSFTQSPNFLSKQIINFFPSVKVVAELLGKLSHKVAKQIGTIKTIYFLMESKFTRKDEKYECSCKGCKSECEHVFKQSVLSLNVNCKIEIIYYERAEKITENITENINEIIVCIYGFSNTYNEIVKKILKNGYYVISDFNIPEDCIEVNSNFVGCICGYLQSRNLNFFKSLAESLTYFIIQYKNSNKREEVNFEWFYANCQYYQSPLGTFYFNEGQEFFLPLYYMIKKEGEWVNFPVDYRNDVKPVQIENATAQLNTLPSLIQSIFSKRTTIDKLVNSLHEAINKIIKDSFHATDMHWYDSYSLFDLLKKGGLHVDDSASIKTNAVLQIALNTLELEDNDTYIFYDQGNNKLVLNSIDNLKKIKYIAKSQFSKIKYTFNNTVVNDGNVSSKILKYLESCIEAGDNYLYYFYLHTTDQKFATVQLVSKTKYTLLELNILKNILQISFWGILDQIRVREITEASYKSAKSAIMSRNMSHNLGSHVMFYIKQKLQSVNKIKAEKVLTDLFDSYKTPYSCDHFSNFCDSSKENDVELPFLVGLGRFLNYIQERQDYIATLATNYIPASSQVNFKEFIYDELKIDLKSRRHPEVKGVTAKNLLLDYIAYSEGYVGSDAIELRFGDFDGRDAKKSESLGFLRKFEISIPGGVIGRQAIFSILENIIRNAAKHGVKRDDGKLVIQMDIVDDIGESCVGCLHDYDKVQQLKREEIQQLCESSKNKYYFLRIQSASNAGAFEQIKTYLESPYVLPDGTMDDNAKGIKEMRISSAWLRGFSLDIAIPDGEPPVLIVGSTAENQPQLEYYICLPRVKDVAILKSAETLDADKEDGVRLFSLNHKLQGVPLSHVLKEIANYNVIVSDKVLSTFRYTLPFRVLESQETRNVNDNQFAEWLKLWFRTYFTQTDEGRLIILDRTLAEDTIKNRRKDLYSPHESGDWDIAGRVVFSRHYRGLSKETERNAAVAKKYESAYFVESITGANSTSRLIRECEWNEEWQYKLLTAGLLRVGIFDERLFHSMCPNNESISKKLSTIKQDQFHNVINDKINRYSGDDLLNELFYYVSPYIKTDDDRWAFVYSIRDNKGDYLKKYDYWNTFNTDRAQLFHEKRVWFYNIVFEYDSENKPIANIIGYNAPIREKIGVCSSDWGVRLLGTIKATKSSDSYELNFHTSFLENKLDFICIHQGILDKLYHHFKISSDNVKAKHALTHCIYKRFSKNYNDSLAIDSYLQGLIIHSGRSKPSAKDMPQKQPFIQFAALDHAVRDCKYTLSELLLNAHYEYQ